VPSTGKSQNSPFGIEKHLINVVPSGNYFKTKANMKELFAGVLALLLSVSAMAEGGDAPRGRLSDTVRPLNYRLTLAIDPRQANFIGQAEIRILVREPTQTIWLHGNGLTVARVAISSRRDLVRARYREVDGTLGVARLDLDAPLPSGVALIRMDYAASFQKTPQGLYRVEAGGEWYVFSQLEPIDARRVFPGFDEPGFKTPFDITVIVPSGNRVISNSRLAARTPGPNSTTRYRFMRTEPLPTYLLAFAVGPLDVVEAPPVPANAVRHTPLPIRFVATRGQGPSLAFAVRETSSIVARLETYFGIPFPYPKLDLIAAPGRLYSMENAGAIIFSDSTLLLGVSPTVRQQSNFGITAAHEIAHQWFGDLVTPAWWDDIWLNEAFAQWMGAKIADEWRPANAIASEQLSNTLEAMDVDALGAGRPIHQSIDASTQIQDAFDSITYNKGAGVIGMVESYLGKERFRSGVRLHLRRHIHGTATAQDFFAAMAEAAHEPAIIDAFRSFIEQPGVPLVTIAVNSDERSALLTQSRYRPLGVGTAASRTWNIPMCVSAYADTTARRICALLATVSAPLSLGGGPKPQALLPNAGGAGYYRFGLDGASFDALVVAAPKLPPREATVLADSVGAAFDAGSLSLDRLVRMARALAVHRDRTAALMLAYRLADIHDRVVDTPARSALERLLDTIYGPRLRELGADPEAQRYSAEPSDRQLMRRELVGIVALWARDAEIRRVLAAAAQRSLEDDAALDPLLRSRAWAVGVQSLAPAFRQAIETRLLESKDPQIRQDAAVALGYAEETESSRRALALTLDPRVPPEAAYVLLYLQFVNPITRPAAWHWLNEQKSAVASKLPEGYGQQFLAQLGGSLCSAEDRDAFQAALATRLATAAELALRRTSERIDVCIAVKAAHQAEFAAMGRAPN